MVNVKWKYDDLMNPVVQALKNLGGSGTIEEINNKVAEIENIPSEQLEVLHNPDKGGITEIEYRISWARTWLKQYGVIENSSRGVWSLTEKGSAIERVDEKDVVRVVREKLKKNKKELTDSSDETDNAVEWQEELLDVILEMSPSGFERLVQRLLRESGFVQVEVTGQSGDGGV
ncbi:MAG: winged helix-turn-helix domain-containing protein, partial [bacterium]|nr:winged helix-turn-helix domain-containing protein [bacterium]